MLIYLDNAFSAKSREGLKEVYELEVSDLYDAPLVGIFAGGIEMVRVSYRKLFDCQTFLGRRNDYEKYFKPGPSPETLDIQQGIDPSAIDALVGEIPVREAFFYSEAFRQRAQAREPNDPWCLLDLVFSLEFWPDNDADPLGRLRKLSSENISALQVLFSGCRDAEIRSRLGDVLWLVTGDRQAMEIAIDAYLESGLRLEDPLHWGHAIRRYQRAAELAMDPVGRLFLRRRISEFVLDRVRYYEGKDPYFFTPQALDILVKLRIGDPGELYWRACALGEQARALGESGRARACYRTAEKISRWAKNESGIRSARTAIAETWVEEAERLVATGEFLTLRYVWRMATLAYRGLGDEAKAADLLLRLKETKRIRQKGTRPPGMKTLQTETN